MAIANVPSQLTTPATAIASGRGPCRNSSAPIIIGIGPAITSDTLNSVSTAAYDNSSSSSTWGRANRFSPASSKVSVAPNKNAFWGIKS